MATKLHNLFKKEMSGRLFWVLVVLITLVKMGMTRFQMVYTWIDGAPLDDELMFRAAQSITSGQWLGAYDWLTLSKHMFFAVWLAVCHWLHLPYWRQGNCWLAVRRWPAAWRLHRYCVVTNNG